MRNKKEKIDIELRALGLNPVTGPFFPPPAEMRRQHALSITSTDGSGRDRTQTIESYTGDLMDIPLFTTSIEPMQRNRNPYFGVRVRTHSETEPKKDDKVRRESF